MKIVWQPKATKQLKKIGDRTIQERLLAAARTLADFPHFPQYANVKQ
jgi:mRNA-degrading endonuclease RelE of RelBE toxin-antitoxin system